MKKRRKNVGKKEKAFIRHLWQEGWDSYAIAARVGRGQTTVMYHVRDLPRRRKWMTAAMLMPLKSQGLSSYAIARRVGATPRGVRLALNRIEREAA